MGNLRDLVQQMKQNPNGVRFNDLCKVCDHYFGKARQSGGNHRVYKMPWRSAGQYSKQQGQSKVLNRV